MVKCLQVKCMSKLPGQLVQSIKRYFGFDRISILNNILLQLEAIQDRFRNTIGDISNELKLLKQHSVMLMEQLQIIEEKHPTLM